MKATRIGNELIRIVCIHTECTLTTIHIECAFGQSTSIGGLKANCIITEINKGVIYLCVIDCAMKQEYKKTNNKRNTIASLR